MRVEKESRLICHCIKGSYQAHFYLDWNAQVQPRTWFEGPLLLPFHKINDGTKQTNNHIINHNIVLTQSYNNTSTTLTFSIRL